MSFAGQNIVATIAFIIDILRAHQSSDAAVLVILSKRLPVLSVVVFEVEEVVSSTAVVLLASIELGLLDF